MLNKFASFLSYVKEISGLFVRFSEVWPEVLGTFRRNSGNAVFRDFYSKAFWVQSIRFIVILGSIPRFLIRLPFCRRTSRCINAWVSLIHTFARSTNSPGMLSHNFWKLSSNKKKIETNSKLTLCPCACFDLRLRTRAKLKGERDGNLDKEERNNSFTILICHGIWKLILFPCSVFPVLLSLPFHFSLISCPIQGHS